MHSRYFPEANTSCVLNSPPSVSTAQHKYAGRWNGLIPLAGICLFILLYVVAAMNYPGGSNADASEKGYSLMHNYWCDLLDYWSKNGSYNRSRPFALTGMILLCSSLTVLWYSLPQFIMAGSGYQKPVQFAGITAMIAAIFVFTRYHDLVIYVSGGFGAMAFLGTFIGLYKSRQHLLLGLGVLCFTLCAVNYYIFQTRQFISLLPIIQKLTFLLCLFWFGLIGVRINRLNNNNK